MCVCCYALYLCLCLAVDTCCMWVVQGSMWRRHRPRWPGWRLTVQPLITRVWWRPCWATDRQSFLQVCQWLSLTLVPTVVLLDLTIAFATFSSSHALPVKLWHLFLFSATLLFIRSAKIIIMLEISIFILGLGTDLENISSWTYKNFGNIRLNEYLKHSWAKNVICKES